MPDSRRKFDQEFREGAVRIVRETGKPIAQIARDLGVPGVSAPRAGAAGDVQVRPQADLENAYAEKARLRARRQEQYQKVQDVSIDTAVAMRVWSSGAKPRRPAIWRARCRARTTSGSNRTSSVRSGKFIEGPCFLPVPPRP